MSKDWKFGKNAFDKHKYYHKSRKVVLIPHSTVTTHGGKLKEPVSSGYSIEIETPYEPKEVQYYLKDTTRSFPNYINNHKHYKTIKDVRKAMVKWTKNNNENVDRMVMEMQTTEAPGWKKNVWGV